MTASHALYRAIPILRWIAWVWTVLVAVVTLWIIVAPDPYAVRPVPLEDWVILFFLHIVTVAGLIVAWRWEIVGGWITLVGYLIGNAAFVAFRGQWPDAQTLLIRFVFWAVPGLLYLLCGYTARHKRKTTFAEGF